MDTWLLQSMLILATAGLVALNGFFVAAEFALVKVRAGRLEVMAREGRPFAKTAQWTLQRLDRSLSACQLGITMASLGLGWIGEPAIARLLEPAFRTIGVSSPALLHALAFAIAFSVITAAHIVLGEQAPKIFAIRRPGRTARWCAAPLKAFYILSYPLLMALNAATAFVLRRVGIEGVSEHETPHSEEEIRALLTRAHTHGELTRSEHKLLGAVFDFDESIARQVMVPRVDVQFFDINQTYQNAMGQVRRSKHTRYPLCDGSLDKVLGFVHIKDLLQIPAGQEPDLRSICRPPRYVPETMPLGRLLGIFRATRQHLAFIVDEYGGVAGVVTFENVVERIVGPVQDEFDDELPAIVPEEAGSFIVQGGAHIEELNKALKIELSSPGVETVAGLITQRLGRIAEPGDRVDLGSAVAEVLEVQTSRPTRIRLTLPRRVEDGTANGD